MKLPTEVEGRQQLADEIHARPFEPLSTPGAALAIATLREGPDDDALCIAHLARLGGEASGAGAATQCQVRCGALRVRWERHTEFHTFTVFTDLAELAMDHAFDTGWLDALPHDWLASLPGRMISATQLAVLPCPGDPPHARVVAPLFGSDLLVGNRVAEGAATVVSDLRTKAGVTRFLVFDHAMNRRRAGRTVQRLIEVDTYRMMALRSLPLASRRMGQLAAEETQLASLMARFHDATDSDEVLLHELVTLAAEVEHAMAENSARFAATRAYSGIVNQRLLDLREILVPGLQPLSEFLERRFRPAMDSCAATAARQAQLSERIARAAQLLQTRSEVERERQNQALLSSLDRRQGLQLRLQETVEGLSVIAMTYYGVGLSNYLLKPLAKAMGWHETAVTLVAVPVIALLVLLNVRRLRRHLHRSTDS
ncbi:MULTISPECIES: DUF3422 family protein [unclassified Variovorax]|uniref:DUF3422 family protein n=1 Tax=unclassified Variovorax TaxID=663243 RepID=UPI0034E8852A